MAVATYTPTLSSDGLDELWRKEQLGVVEAFGFGVPEWNFFNKLKGVDTNWSTREITMELDLQDGYGVASIPEGGYEARPSSPLAVTATLTYILLNKRFTISLTAKYIHDKRGTKAMLTDQLKWQSKKAVQAIRLKVGNYMYGFSTGVLAHAAENATGTTHLTIDNMYGIAGEGATTDSRQAQDLFTALDYIGILTSGGTFRSIKQPSAIAGSNVLTHATDWGTTADGDLLVGAASMENTSNDGTDYNRGLVGLLDMITSTTVHNYANTSNSRWDPGIENTSGGRFTGVKLRKMKQGINNNGGGTLDRVLWAQGVENDVFAQLQAGLRFSDSFGMEMDGSPKSRGVKFLSTKRVPDGYVFGWDSKRSVGKGTLLPEPGQQAWGGGEKIKDQSGMVYSLDFPVFMATKSRANMGMYSGITEQ
jgi:hypothetical protein